MKIEEVSTKMCPFISYRDVVEVVRTCRGPACACWETTKRKREEMEYDITEHKGPFYASHIPEELRTAG